MPCGELLGVAFPVLRASGMTACRRLPVGPRALGSSRTFSTFAAFGFGRLMAQRVGVLSEPTCRRALPRTGGRAKNVYR